jgi:cyclophilin family peptidyl-prolyl cis-trans isomerase
MPSFTLARGLRALGLLAAVALGSLSLNSAAADSPKPTRVRVETSMGTFVIEVNNERAPLSSANFLQYVRSGFYDGTLFHRVIANFVIQGGGYDSHFMLKTPAASIANESGNGLSNKRYTVGLARQEAPHSGNSQFYINLADNDDLDPTPLRWGYAVFGRVVSGFDAVEKIGRVATGELGPFKKDAPQVPVIINKAAIDTSELPAAAPAPAPGPAVAPPAAPPAAAPPAAPPPAAPPASGGAPPS